MDFKVRDLAGLGFELLSSKLVLGVLLLKIISSIFFISYIPADFFLPFLNWFVENPLSNPYNHFFSLHVLRAFPYPPFMLLITSIPFHLTANLHLPVSGLLNNFLLRVPLILADFIILCVLVLLNPGKKKTVIYLYWLSPVIFYINYVHGQLDIIPTAILLLSLFALSKNKVTLSAILLGLALATKSHMFLVVPFFLAYIWQKNHDYKDVLQYGVFVLAPYILLILPFVFTPGFFELVFRAQEQLRIFDLAITFEGGQELFVVLAVYLYLVFKAFSYRRTTKNILFMMIGTTFTLFVTLVRPSQGWYAWCIPFMVLFLTKADRKYLTLYLSFQALYFIYFGLVADTDYFIVFREISYQFSMHRPIIGIFGSLGPLLFNVVFTLLSSNLLYLGYLMYRYGVRSSQIFQEKTGIPLIGIAGDSGSGKSTFAKVLTKMFGLNQTTIICGDDIHKWERGDENWRHLTHLNPVSNNIHMHHRHMHLLKRGEIVERSRYDHLEGRFMEPKNIRPKRLILDEGLHTFVIGDKRLHDLTIFLDPETPLKKTWKIKRDQYRRGHDKKVVLQQMKRRKPDFEKYIKPQKEYADLIFRLCKDRKNKFYLECILASQIDVESLLSVLATNSSLQMKMNYSGINKIRIQIKGEVGEHQLLEVLESLDLDYTEYGIRTDKILPNMSGLLQIITLFCLDQKLKDSIERGLENV